MGAGDCTGDASPPGSHKSKRMKQFFWGVGIVTVLLTGCASYEEQRDRLPDTPERGSIRISVDETFKPVMDELIQVYESNHPATKINVEYKTEADCLREVLIIVSGLSIQDPRESNSENKQVAIERQAEYKHVDSDFLSLVKLWDAYEALRQGSTQAVLR